MPPTNPAIAAVTNAVVASCVVFVPPLAVGPAGIPVNVGDASGAAANRAMTCATVSAIGVAGEPVLLPSIEFAARFAIFANVTAAAAIVGPGYVPVRSPLAGPVGPPPDVSPTAYIPLAVPSV